MTSAIVCGDSLRRKTRICSGGVRRRNSNGRRSIVAARRPMISLGALRAERALEHLAGVVDAALGDVVPRPGRSRRASFDDLARQMSIGTFRALAISSESASTSVVLRCLKTSAARSSPRRRAARRPSCGPAASFGRGAGAGRGRGRGGQHVAHLPSPRSSTWRTWAATRSGSRSASAGRALCASRSGRASAPAAGPRQPARAAGLELGERRRRLDLAQPRRLRRAPRARGA